MQIFSHSKFGINQTASLKVMAKKFLGQNLNFLAIILKPAVQLIPNFEFGKICKILSLFAKSSPQKFHLGVNNQGLYLVKLKFGGETNSTAAKI